MPRLLLTRIAKPRFRKTVGRTTILGPTYVGARVGYMAMIMPEEIPMGSQKPMAVVVPRPGRQAEESEDAEWERMGREALSSDELLEIRAYLLATGQASA